MMKVLSIAVALFATTTLFAHDRAASIEPCLGVNIEIQNVYEMVTASSGGYLVDDALVAATVVELASGKTLKPGQIVYPGMKLVAGEFFVDSIYPVVLEINGEYYDATAGQLVIIGTDPTHKCQCRCKCTASNGAYEWLTVACLSSGCSGYAGASCQMADGTMGSTANCSMILVRCN